MNFKRKAGAAVLAIAAASAIAVPGVAMAVTAEPSVATLASEFGVTATIASGTVADADLDLTITDGDQDDIEAVIETYGNGIDRLTIDSDDLDAIDVSDATMVTYIKLDGSDLTDIDGLDQVGTEIGTSSDSVTVEIAASDLTTVDFGENDAALKVTLDADLETLDMSDLENMTYLNVSLSDDLESLDISGDDDLVNLDISNTNIATLDASDTSIVALDVTETTTGEPTGLRANNIELDKQYAVETVNDDDDDFNDYTLDMDSITDGYAERIAEEDADFNVKLTSDSAYVAGGDTSLQDFDYDNGELVVTAEDSPYAIQYHSDADVNTTANVDIEYVVTFEVKTSGSRIAGSDRYDTMVELNTNEGDNDIDEVFGTKEEDGSYTNKPTDVVVASGAGYADALSASALAGALNTGIVTTPVDSMTDDTIDMLDDMANQGTAYIVGGTSAVSYAVEQQLTDLGFSIKRMAGADRFDTAVKTQDKIQDLIDDTDVITNQKTVIIASGVSYADALAIAPYAYNKNTPIVLVGADGTMDDDTAALFNKYKNDYSRAIVVGGTAVVSDDVIDTLEGYDMDVIRLAGADRFETNLVINDWLDRGTGNITKSDDIFEAAGYTDDDIDDFNDADIKADAGLGFEKNDFNGTAYVVTGLNYADALAVAPLAGINGGTINMVSDTNLTTVTEAADNDAATKVVGGTSAVSSDVFDAIEDL